MKVLLTGGTGLLGGAMVSSLAAKADVLYFLSRKFLTDDQKSLLPKNVKIVLGDITHPELIFDPQLKEELFRNVNVIIHAAAYYDLFGTKEKHFLSNVTGTHNVLFFASQCQQLSAFHHVSSIAVAGDYQGVFLEDDLDCLQTFPNEYARSKYESEYQVRKAKLPIKPIIYRPGILIGHSKTGEISKSDGPYYFFKFLSHLKKVLPKKLKYLLFPFDPTCHLPVLPYDLAADFICRSVVATQERSYDEEGIRCYHLFSPDSPTLDEFTKDSLQVFGLDLKLLPLSKFFKVPLSKIPLLEKVGMPQSMLSYMYAKTTYDQRQLDSFLTKHSDHKGQLNYANYKEIFFLKAQEMLL